MNFIILAVFIIQTTGDFNSADSLLTEAHRYFEQGNYEESVEILKSALTVEPSNPEIYYYLGYYTHYLGYDSRPYPGYTSRLSDSILGYLTKAISLDPTLRNSYYFLGAEYGVISRRSIQLDYYDQVITSLTKGREQGGYPDWLLEYARNLLDCCKPEAILFISGDAEANSIAYLQWVENYRTDISTIIIPLCNRSWYIQILKTGYHDFISPVPISWSQEQIYSANNYKWNSNEIKVLLDTPVISLYHLTDSLFKWTLSPDLYSDTRNYLSPAKAVIADIIQQNAFYRPVYFSLSGHHLVEDDLDSNLILSGLAHQLVPFNVYQRESRLNVMELENFLSNQENFSNFPDVAEHDLPRISGILNNYRYLYLNLIIYYYNNNDIIKTNSLIKNMETFLPDSVLPLPDGIAHYLEEFKNSTEP